MSESLFPRAVVEHFAVEGFTRGWNDALNAAREAIAALDIGRDVRFSVDVRAEALAAIDALKEKP